jgi:cytochrome oxidase Cu insertion factor (SCO1/SenC/PrrC family)
LEKDMPRWLAAILVVIVLSLVAVAGVRLLAPAATDTAQQGEVLIGGPFSLTDQTGKQVTDQDYRGRFMLVYFGYTFCPDMCPLGLQTIAQTLDELSPAMQDRIAPLFVTIDPARDTVAVMRDYVAQFHPRLIGLTGSEAEIAQAVRAYRVYAHKADATAADGSYLVDHSTFTYLMDENGKYLTHFGHGTTPEEMAKRLQELIPAS